MSVLLAIDGSPGERELWLDLLRAELPGEHLLASREGVAPETFDAAIVANPPRGALAGLPRLALIQSLWAGVERLLADETIPSRVPIARMVDPAMSEAMAETALWAVLSLHRGYFAYARRQLEGVWRVHAQRRADEVEVAVLGLGRMGATAARRLVFNGYRVRGWSARPTWLDGVDCVAGEEALDALLASAEIVVNLLPLTPATRGLFDARAFATMRPGASLVNLARGAHVVDADLIAALDAGQLRHAVLDVFHTEPLPAGHAFWSHPRVTVLPHAAALTDPRTAAAIAARNLRAWRAGQPIENRVDRVRGY